MSHTHHIISADRLDGSVILVFEDGRCGVFKADLLYAMLPQVEELRDLEAAGPGMAESDASGSAAL